MTSKRYKGSRTEFEKKKIAKHNMIRASQRRGSTQKTDEQKLLESTQANLKKLVLGREPKKDEPRIEPAIL